MDLSIVMCGRNDDHGGSYRDRIMYAFEANAKILSVGPQTFETLFVEWSPMGKRFHELESMASIFEKLHTRHIVVEDTVPKRDGLNPSVFYEYFAKNIGIRMASGVYVMVLNTDCYLSEELHKLSMDFISERCSGRFCRPRNRICIDRTTGNVVSSFNVSVAGKVDSHVCGAYSGDFLLATKSDLVDRGKGYDEVNPSHRRNRQTSMDGEILHNLHRNGVTLMTLAADYYHVDHPRVFDVEGNEYNMDGYENRQGWGFVNYEHVSVSKNLTIIR